MIGYLKSFLSERAPAWGLPATNGWQVLIHNNYRPHFSNLNLFWFCPGNKSPRVFTRLYYRAENAEREFSNLEEVYRCAPELVPRPLYAGKQGFYWTLWMEAVPGSVVHESSPSALIESVVVTIAILHEKLRQGMREITEQRYKRLVTEPIHTLAGFDHSPVVLDGCARLLQDVSVEWFNTVPSLPQHGDLCASNVVAAEGQCRFVDWESFGQVDLPYYDLFTFVFSLVSDIPERWNRRLRAQMPGFVKAYARRLELPVEDIPVLLPLSLTNWFHLHCREGRHEFTTRTYKTIEAYFRDPVAWNKVFLPTVSAISTEAGSHTPR